MDVPEYYRKPLYKEDTELKIIKNYEGEKLFRYWHGDSPPPKSAVQEGDYWETLDKDSAYVFRNGEWSVLRLGE